MVFLSFEFVLLLVFTLLLFYLVPARLRLYLLALADVAFYLAVGLNYLFLLIVVSTIAYFCALKAREPGRRIYAWVGILAAAANLLFFKYTGFILDNLGLILPVRNLTESSFVANIVLPLGLSFYTFQIIAYLADVAGDKIQPCRNFVRFWVFISFFGKLSAGPIMRGQDLLPQMEETALGHFHWEDIRIGFYYITLGITKKIVLADTLGVKVAYYFKHIALLNSFDSWFAAYLFAFQLYFDFSAYSDIAVGIGRLFGLRLKVNFLAPYVSANPSEFWRRWHITLSTWLRDYIYIPLGGSRKGLLPQCLFLIAAMAVSGLWHGAAWTFVAWGVYHGLLTVGYKLASLIGKNRRGGVGDTLIGRGVSVFIFFHLTVLGWVLFKTGAISEGLGMIVKMITFSQVEYSPFYPLYFSFIAFLYVLHVLEYLLLTYRKPLAAYWENKVPAWLRAICYTALLLILVLYSRTEPSSFIYFQF